MLNADGCSSRRGFECKSCAGSSDWSIDALVRRGMPLCLGWGLALTEVCELLKLKCLSEDESEIAIFLGVLRASDTERPRCCEIDF